MHQGVTICEASLLEYVRLASKRLRLVSLGVVSASQVLRSLNTRFEANTLKILRQEEAVRQFVRMNIVYSSTLYPTWKAHLAPVRKA